MLRELDEAYQTPTAARPNSWGSPYRRSGMRADWRARTPSGSPRRASSSRALSCRLGGAKRVSKAPRGACRGPARALTEPARLDELRLGRLDRWEVFLVVILLPYPIFLLTRPESLEARVPN